MQVLQQRCCGLDVHKKAIVACILITAPDGAVEKQRRSFSTMTGGLLTLVDWLDAW
jgi:transposase